MFSTIVITFFAVGLAVSSVAQKEESCKKHLYVNGSEPIVVESCGNESCLFYIDTDFDSKISGTCGFTIEIPSNTTNCDNDNHLQLFREQIVQLDASGDRYCGTGTINITSIFNTLLLSFRTASTANNFSCTFRAEPAVCECGWSKQAKIVNGRETEINEFGFSAAFIFRPQNFLYCGGTIIAAHYIATAAHCFNLPSYADPSKIYALVGAHDYKNLSVSSRYAVKHDIDRLIVHERFNRANQDNDIALARLREPIVYTRGVGPACLPFNFAREAFDWKTVTIFGWGAFTYRGRYARRLQKTELQVWPHKKCVNSEMDWVNEHKMCTFKKKTDACQSDSGGGVVYFSENRYYHVGIISYGVKCATFMPGVNTRVTDYIDWIVEHTSDAHYCRPQVAPTPP